MFEFIPQNLSIMAMRTSGYRDTAHALAELIDNSVQAGEDGSETTQIEVICVDRAPVAGARKRLTEIAVFDSAVGMSPATLRKALQFGNGTRLNSGSQKGIGKFGMGLPNSSISQCTLVEVWSWQNGEVYYSFLDVEMIRDKSLSEVPEPVKTLLPTEWINKIASPPASHGTLVVWRNLDRVTWKQSSTLLKNLEFIVGRVYRNFISSGQARIRLAAYEETETGEKVRQQRYVKPNDPLYLMKDTNTPAPWDRDPAFVPFESPIVLHVGFRGEDHLVTITGSICKPEVRNAGGSSRIGKHAQANQGISVVRAKRELEINRTFENSYDPRERWWGVQVEFDPGLDDVFGVTNNKQAATGFVRRSLTDDADEEQMSRLEFTNMLETDRDPRLPMYVISERIEKLLDRMRREVISMRVGERTRNASVQTPETIVEQSSTASVTARRKLRGDSGRSDKQEDRPAGERTDALSLELEQIGVDEKKAKEIAVEYVSKDIKFRVKHASLPATTAFFDVSAAGGVIIVTLNTDSSLHETVLNALQDEDRLDAPYLKEFLFALLAWARMEDETGGDLLHRMKEFRQLWGQILADMLANASEVSM